MKILFWGIAAMFLLSCSLPSGNPFFQQWDTPYQVPDFSKIKESHYLPAFQKGIDDEKAQLDSIVTNPEAPTFVNTVEALEQTGEVLRRVSHVFYNMLSAKTTDNLQDIARQVSPLMSQHSDDILLNDALFQRIMTVY